MKILVAEYAIAAGLGGTFIQEGRAMLSILAESFQRCRHEVLYPTFGPTIEAGTPIFLKGKGPGDFREFLARTEVDAGLVIAPDDLLPEFLEALETNTANLGCRPAAARLCADKLESTLKLKESGVPVADVVDKPAICGCSRYVIKPRYGCGSEGVRITSNPKAPEGYVATRYIEGMHLSTSFIVGDKFLPLTINRQLIEFAGDCISYNGSQVPYNTPRAAEIWDVARRASEVLGLRGYAGIDMVVGDLPRVVDVNARPTTSMIGISKVMKEEMGDLILRSRFGALPAEARVEGHIVFTKEDF